MARIIDLFAGESLPLHCLTYEFFKVLSSRMTSDGVFYFNTNLPQHAQLPGSGYNALGHVVAGIRKAGFRSVFINNQQDQGFLYVFKEDIRPAALLDQILRFAANTQNPEAINVFIDGASYKNDVLQGGVAGQDASRGNPFPLNAVREFRILTQNFKAEYQKASSAIIAATTQSGTNQWQGNAFECRVSWAALWKTSICENPTPQMITSPRMADIIAPTRVVLRLPATDPVVVCEIARLLCCMDIDPFPRGTPPR